MTPNDPRRKVALFAAIPLLIAIHLYAQTPAGAQAQQASGDWTGAEATWRKLTLSAPSDFRYWTSLGACLAHQNRFSEAIADYRKAISLRPKDAQTNLNLGLALFKTGRLAEAIAPLKIAHGEMPPMATQTNLLLGMSFYGVGKSGEAVPYLEAAQRQDASNAELELVLARAYLHSNNFTKAKEQFAHMLTVNPDSGPVHLLLAEAYDGLGKGQAALNEFRIAARSNDVPGAHFGVGYLLLRDKNYADAAVEFRKELAINPKDHAALAYLGDTLLKSDELEAARSSLNASVAVTDNLWITHLDLGILAEREHNPAAAIRQLCRAVALNPKRAEIHFHLAKAYKALGDTMKAQQELRLVTSLHASQTDDLVTKISGYDR